MDNKDLQSIESFKAAVCCSLVVMASFAYTILQKALLKLQVEMSDPTMVDKSRPLITLEKENNTTCIKNSTQSYSKQNTNIQPQTIELKRAKQNITNTQKIDVPQNQTPVPSFNLDQQVPVQPQVGQNTSNQPRQQRFGQTEPRNNVNSIHHQHPIDPHSSLIHGMQGVWCNDRHEFIVVRGCEVFLSESYVPWRLQIMQDRFTWKLLLVQGANKFQLENVSPQFHEAVWKVRVHGGEHRINWHRVSSMEQQRWWTSLCEKLQGDWQNREEKISVRGQCVKFSGMPHHPWHLQVTAGQVTVPGVYQGVCLILGRHAFLLEHLYKDHARWMCCDPQTGQVRHVEWKRSLTISFEEIQLTPAVACAEGLGRAYSMTQMSEKIDALCQRKTSNLTLFHLLNTENEKSQENNL